MKIKRHNDSHLKKHKHGRKETNEHRRRKSISSRSSESDEWVEKTTQNSNVHREDWMSMTGMLKTYTKDDIKLNQEEKMKKHIDSYNPATSSRELNPYWKDGGAGLPQTSESFRKSRSFMKPLDDGDYYSKSLRDQEKTNYNESRNYIKNKNESYIKSSNSNLEETDDMYSHKSYNWRKSSKIERKTSTEECLQYDQKEHKSNNNENEKKGNQKESPYLSDEKMNKLAAKIVKAEIMGDEKQVKELKAKLEAAREYRQQNPDVKEKDDVLLMSTNSIGNSRPLIKNIQEDLGSGGVKRKAETHVSGKRVKYFCNDDKYNLAHMFEQEKYGSNYDNEAELAKITAKHKNPNDDLEDIFMDEITKNKNTAKESEREKQTAISQHIKMEKSLEGCEFCVDSKNMLKHLMVSCGNKVYVALPARKSLVTGHCIISTVQHSTCVTSLDEDVWEEVMNYRRALTKFFNSQNKDVVFYETATRLHRYPHVMINCVPLPRDIGDTASIYFKKALLECEAEWSMNKKVIDLKGKNIRTGVPKGLPYFWVDFGMDSGFAHVIEDQHLFPKTFAEEIIGGMLDLDHTFWKCPQKEYGDQQRKKVLDFLREWKHFDINVRT